MNQTQYLYLGVSRSTHNYLDIYLYISKTSAASSISGTINERIVEKLSGISTKQKVLFCKRMASWFRQHSKILKSIWYYRYRKWWTNNTINSLLSFSSIWRFTGPCSEYCVINSYFLAEMLYSKKYIIIRMTSISAWIYIPQLLRPGENTVKYFHSIWFKQFNLII